MEARDVSTFARQHPELRVLGIDVRDSTARARDFHRRYGWTWPSLADPYGRLATRLKAYGTPTVVFLDRSHRVVARIAGGADLADLADTYRRHVR